ncbi:MAG: MFS transporter, partial [Armatimonadetes bacterium]|nr:MFS transporter [Armatimonadota bacterium]
MTETERAPRVNPEAITVAVVLALGYVGVYLCRKNLSVAIPMLLEAGVVPNKEATGWIITLSNIAYMSGKFIAGPVVDRWGGRVGFLGSLLGVAVFCALGGIVPGIAALAAVYSANRLFGAAGWAAMMKLAAGWFPPRRLGAAIAGLSLSYIAGGICAALLAGVIARQTGDWRMVMALPAAVLGLYLLLAAWLVRPGPIHDRPAGEQPVEAQPDSLAPARGHFRIRVLRLLQNPQYVTILVLSFTLTLLRDCIANWQVDFIRSLQPGQGDLAKAAFGSIGFEVAGAFPILLMGVLYDRLGPSARRWLITGILLLLSLTLFQLTTVTRASAGLALPLLAGVGLLLYGPYSVLGGVVAVESGGEELAATASGMADGVGYAATILAGVGAGWILDRGGYGMAFSILGGMTL